MKIKKDSNGCKNYSGYGPRGDFLVTFRAIGDKTKVIEKGITETIRKLNKSYSRSYSASVEFLDMDPPKPPYVRACVKVTGDYRAVGGVEEYLRYVERIKPSILYPQVKHNNKL